MTAGQFLMGGYVSKPVTDALESRPIEFPVNPGHGISSTARTLHALGGPGHHAKAAAAPPPVVVTTKLAPQVSDEHTPSLGPR